VPLSPYRLKSLAPPDFPGYAKIGLRIRGPAGKDIGPQRRHSVSLNDVYTALKDHYKGV
jgi:hypothetical protein